MNPQLPRVVADTPLDATIEGLLGDRVEILSWSVALSGSVEPVAGIYTYGHPPGGAMLDRFPGLKVISNYGVGVDHINLEDAASRGIPVEYARRARRGDGRPGLRLLMASARRIVEGDRYARSPELPLRSRYMLGREVHGKTLGIIGMGRIGQKVARRAIGFDMTVLYHNRHRREDVERVLAPSSCSPRRRTCWRGRTT